MDWNQGNVYFVFCCFPRKNIRTKKIPTHPPQKKMQICKNKQKQAESNDIPLFLLPLLFRCPIFVFSNPTLAQRVLMGERDSVWCWSRNWTAWKLILGFLIKRSQKKSLPDLADILGQPQEDLAVSFNEMCQYCSCQPRFPTLFAVTWREAASENLCGSVKMMLNRIQWCYVVLDRDQMWIESKSGEDDMNSPLLRGH